MQKQPLVSIIIPTYNRAHLIAETLNSVMAQTYTNWECILVDDGSTDNTSEVVYGYLKKDTRFKYHIRPENIPSGGNGARNYGFELCKGEYVNWFDDDDVMHQEFLRTKVDHFDQGCNFLIALGYFENQEELKGKISPKDFQVKNLFKDYLMWNIRVITHNVLFKRKFLENVKLFSKDIIRGQETEFFSRIFFRIPNNKYKIIEAPLFYYRQHEETKSHQSKAYHSNFKFSQALVFLENFKRSLELKDHVLIKHCLTSVFDVFFSAVKNRDFFLSRYLLKELFILLKEINHWKSYYIICLGKIIILTGSYRYRVKRIFKKAFKFVYS